MVSDTQGSRGLHIGTDIAFGKINIIHEQKTAQPSEATLGTYVQTLTQKSAEQAEHISH